MRRGALFARALATLGVEGCAQAYEITGDACLRLAREVLVRGAAPRAACAHGRYRSVQAGGLGQRESLSARELEPCGNLEQAAALAAAAAGAAAIDTRAAATSLGVRIDTMRRDHGCAT